MSASRRSLGDRPRLRIAIRRIIGIFAVLGVVHGFHLATACGGEPAGEPPAADEPGAEVLDFPLALLPATTPAPILAIIYSGDGGWRDLDKEIGENLQAIGVPVVGFDTLRYFWTRRSPEEVAASLAAVIDHFTSTWHTPNVVLIGYSFGADILPFAVNRLPDAERSRVRQISLLALGMNADFEIRVGGWLGVPPGEDAPPIAPELQRLDPRLVQCFYGVEEKAQTACVLSPGAEVVETPGGHHFDGDYRAMTQRIADGLVSRGALPHGLSRLR